MMTKLSILEQALGSYYKSSEEYLFYCPFCKHHKKKLSININKNYYKCWVCGLKGKIEFLLKNFPVQYKQWLEITKSPELSVEVNLRDLFLKEKKKNIDICVDVKLPDNFVSLVGNFSAASKGARKYLCDRGVTEEDINTWKLGYTSGGDLGGRIVIPSFDCNGCLNYFVARTFLNDFIKYKNPSESKDIIFNELYVDYNQPIILVEGVFDAIKAGSNSIPILGSNLSEDGKLFQRLVENKTDVYIGLDPDARKKENKIIKSLLRYGLRVAKIEITPYADIGEMSKEEFQKRKKEAIFIKSESFFKNNLLQRLEACI
jgi:DNA primase